MKQIARNLTDAIDGFLKDKRQVLMDHDAHLSARFRTIPKDACVTYLRVPSKSSNLNAQPEKFHLSITSECLDRVIFFGEQLLRNATHQFLAHFHRERNHQGLDNAIIEPSENISHDAGDSECREGLGGMLRYYYRAAA